MSQLIDSTAVTKEMPGKFSWEIREATCTGRIWLWLLEEVISLILLSAVCKSPGMSLETLKVTHIPGMTSRHSNPTRQSSPWKPSSRWWMASLDEFFNICAICEEKKKENIRRLNYFQQQKKKISKENSSVCVCACTCVCCGVWVYNLSIVCEIIYPLQSISLDPHI